MILAVAAIALGVVYIGKVLAGRDLPDRWDSLFDEFIDVMGYFIPFSLAITFAIIAAIGA